MKKIAILLYCFVFSNVVHAEDGYQLWLRYYLIDNKVLLEQYRTAITGIHINGNSPTLLTAKEEIIDGLSRILGKKITQQKELTAGSLIIGTPASSNLIKSLPLPQLQKAGKEGFVINTLKSNGKHIIALAANTDAGVLYGVFHFLRLLQTHQNILNLSIVSVPKIEHRILNHWDNLDRTVERGYAGCSIWDWHRLPNYIDLRYKDYARANASIGINGTVLTNVNANALVLTPAYLEKVAALANVFRPYGIKVYLTARFSAPVEIGGLKTADPLETKVQQW